MADFPETSEPAAWQRSFAARANNLAWELAEAGNRSKAQDQDMLEAALASCWHWRSVGTPQQIARAELLAGFVLGQLGIGGALSLVEKARAELLCKADPWEVALCHAAFCVALWAEGKPEAARLARQQAQIVFDGMPEGPEKETIGKSLARMPPRVWSQPQADLQADQQSDPLAETPSQPLAPPLTGRPG